MKKRTLVLLFLLLFLTRALLVLSVADVFFYGEELAKGAAAKAMIDGGLGIDHYKLNYGYHEGGGFVISHLKALAFLLVGQSVLAHKLVAMSLTSVLLAIGLWLTNEHFGAKAGLWFGLLFALAPGAFLRFSLLSLGTHFEATIFIALILHYGLRIAFAPSPDIADHIALGLASGFGTYFSLLCLPAIACIGLLLLVKRKRRFFDRCTLFALVALVIGLSPLLWLMTKVGLEAVTVRGHEVTETAGIGFWTSLWDMFFLMRDGDASAWIIFAAYAGVIAAGLFAGARESVAGARSKRFVLLGYLGLFVLLYLASSLAVSPKGIGWFYWIRLCPLWFFAAVLFASFAVDFVAGSRRALAAVSVLAFAALLVSGLSDVIQLAREGRPGELRDNFTVLARTKGCEYTEYIDKVQKHLDGDEADKIAVLRRYDDDARLLAPAISQSLFDHSSRPLGEVIEICRKAFGDDWRSSLLGLRYFVHPGFGHDLPQAFRQIESLPEDVQQLMAEAIGRAGLGPRFRADKLQTQIDMEIDPRFREAFLRGAGWRVYQTFMLRADLAFDFIGRQPARDWPALLDGYHSARQANWLTR